MRHPDYYRGRADETRQIAECVDDLQSKRDLLQAAREWDRFTQQAIEMLALERVHPLVVIRGGKLQ